MMRVPPSLSLVLLVAACSASELPALDGGPDLAIADAPARPGDGPVTLAVDFTVENCPSFDPVAFTCTGKVPLALRFVPMSTAGITGFSWDFGDATVSDPTPAPNHVFSAPRAYTVRLVATGVSGVSQEHTGFVVALPNTAGDPCDATVQCDLDLFCLCPATEACSGTPPRGVCTSECTNGRCREGQACANLRTTSQSLEPWQTSLCLPHCTEDADCAAGLRCRLLPPGGSGGWIHGCFSDMPRDVGEPCRDAEGKLRDDFCVTGLCADFGVLGMCSKRCSDLDACPQGSDCMLMGNGTKLCLRPCVDRAAFPCNRDPLLTCVQPTAGDLGYQVPSTNPTSNTSYASIYCAPRTCTPDDDPPPCSPSGVCVLAGGGSHCVRH